MKRRGSMYWGLGRSCGWWGEMFWGEDGENGDGSSSSGDSGCFLVSGLHKMENEHEK